MKEKDKRTIGRTDKVDFPEWGLTDIDAKIDSGAFTSAIHCEKIEAFYTNGEHHVRFTLYDDEKPFHQECKVFASKQVKNSFGQVEYRYAIKTIVCLFEKNYTIELALTNRSSMKFPVLLGRKMLHDRFIIDVTKHDLSYKEKMKKHREAEKNAKKK